MKRLWKETGQVWQAPKGTTGRPRVINESHRERLREYLDRNPDALMRDIADFLNDECGIDVTVSTVWRTMVRLGWKENRPRAKDRDSLGQWKPTLPRDDNGKPIYGPAKDRRKPKLPKKKKPTPQEALLNRVQIFAQDYMSDPRFDASHDYSHVLRVVNLSRHILRVELAENPHLRYDQLVVEIAALMHDVNDHKYAPKPVTQQQPPAVPMRSNPMQPTQSPSSLPTDMQPPNITQLVTTPSHPPYGHVPPETMPIQGASSDLSNTQNQPPNPQLDPALQPLTDHNTPTRPQPSLPPTPQTAQIQNQPALQPLPTPASKDRPHQHHRTIEEHLIRLRAPAQIAKAVSTICTAISYTYESGNPGQVASILAEHPELAIVQDADRLDALGAVGISRAFVFGGANRRGMEDSISHMDEKLLRLESLMKTNEGKRLARGRAERVRVFRGWWEEEADLAHGVGNVEDMNGDEDMEMEENGEVTENGHVDGGVWGNDPTAGPSSIAVAGAMGSETANGYGGYGNPHGQGYGGRANGGGLGQQLQQQQQQQVQRSQGGEDPGRQLMMEAGML